MPDDQLAPLPLGEQLRFDDEAEDTARSEGSVADLVAQDLEDPATPSRRLRSPAAGLETNQPDPAGFRVPTEPVGRDDQRPIDDVDGL
jgi:hypothetical protein